MIPRTLHLCWLSGDPYPDLIEYCLASWKQKLPGYRIMLWDKSSFDVQGTRWVAEAVAHRKYAFAADYIRLYALHAHGGIYLDADVEVLRSLDELLDLPSFMGYESDGDLEPAVIGAEPGAEWITKCLAYYKDRRFVQPDGSLDMRPLPLIVAETLRTHYRLPSGEVQSRTLLEEARLMLFPSRFFSPKNIHTRAVKLSSDTFCVHHFDGQWVKKNWSHRAKSLLHWMLVTCVGKTAHRKIVALIRKLKS